MYTKQQEAFAAVKGERDYQDSRWANSLSQGHHETGAYLAFIQYYLTQAIAEITQDDGGSLHTVRKIAALAVACMEDNGIVER